MSPVTEKGRDQAREVLHALGGRPRITTDDGSVLDLPPPVLQALAEILRAAADGERVPILRSPRRPHDRAGCSGPRRVAAHRCPPRRGGKLPVRMVGTHRRLYLGDVLAYREASAAKRRAALDEMAREAEELSLYD